MNLEESDPTLDYALSYPQFADDDTFEDNALPQTRELSLPPSPISSQHEHPCQVTTKYC